MMKQQDFNDDDFKAMEAWAKDALKDLPPSVAPTHLQSRILEATTRREKIWWQAPLLSWPRPIRLAALALMTLVVVPLLVILGQTMAWGLASVRGLFVSLSFSLPAEDLVTTWWHSVQLGLVVLVGISFLMGVFIVSIGGLVMRLSYEERKLRI